MKITDQILKEIAQTYCTLGTPLSNLAKDYGVSKTTLVRYFKGDMTIKLPPYIQKQVDVRKKQNYDAYKATYGNLGNIALSREEIIELANKMIDNDMTLEDASNYTGLGASTIYSYLNEENLGNDLYLKIVELYKSNKDRKSVGGKKNG